MDSERFVSKVEGSLLSFKLEDLDMIPRVVNSECVAIGGWKLNVVSLIDSKTNSDFVVQGWGSLEKLIPLRELMIPLLYSTVMNYARFGIAEIEPHWTKLLRLCYWYQKCLGIGNSSFHFKQTEIKRAILKPYRNTEKALNKGKGKDFILAIEQLARTILSYASELKFASLASECGHKVSFSKRNDFVIDNLPSEVKSVYSHATIERKDNEIPRLKIHGKIFGDKFNSYNELFNFVKSKKVWRHICKGYCQNGEIIFIDGTHTFASILLYLLSTNKEVDLSFEKALEIAVKLAKENKRIPIIIIASIGSYDHRLLAFIVPIPRQYFLKWFSQT